MRLGLPCFDAVYGVAGMCAGGATRPYMEATLMMFPRPSRTPRSLFGSQPWSQLPTALCPFTSIFKISKRSSHGDAKP